MSGYTGKLLRVNLTSGQISIEALDLDQAGKFIGGRGLGVWYLSQEVDPSVDPLSADNKVLFATGPLTGAPVPTSARYMVVTKSPLSGTVASSNSGGFWGPELKFAGYDMIIIEGKSPRPCYVTIRDDQVQIHDAGDLWGKLVAETTDALIEAFGDQRARVLTIGPAGERMSPIAAVMNDKWRAAGRSGVGAVLGSKNLKAIVVRGTGRVQSADPQKTKEVAKALQKRIKENAVTGQGLPTYGTAVLVNIINESGVYPTRNFQEAYFPKADQASGEVLAEKHLTGTEACYRCPIACGRKTRVDGVEGGGPEYETLWAFSADCGVDDLGAVIKANRWCNEYGLDTISAGTTIACAMELYQRGLLTDADLAGGAALQFGSGEAIVEWTRRMGAGEGLGARLAMGSYRLAESCGAPELSMSVKKLELPAYDPRGIQGHGLQYATANRGGCHVRGYLIAPEILGVPEKLDPTHIEGKAVWAKTFQDLTAVIDSLGLCLFTSFAYGPDDYRDLLNAVIGTDLTTEEMMTAGERIWNLERTFNLKAGIEADQDTLPKRLLTEPIPAG
ncbi:MAG: aldehyde ferredoxin oxidoreductase family protein, partial [Phycisphaerae bacterium]|nr:aldehyde ferredoxin oxidoreductase family protein [Phycisphaerae bacterium]